MFEDFRSPLEYEMEEWIEEKEFTQTFNEWIKIWDGE